MILASFQSILPTVLDQCSRIQDTPLILIVYCWTREKKIYFASQKMDFHSASFENPIFGTCRAGWNYDFQPAP